MSVMGNVLSKTVAGVNIARFNTSLVRVSGDQDVGGHKRFLHGFSAELLRIDGMCELVNQTEHTLSAGFILIILVFCRNFEWLSNIKGC